MGQADVVVLPSFYREGVPRSLLEAAAMGKPIVTTDAIGCREAVDHGVTGFLGTGAYHTALAKTMSRFIVEPELCQRMGAIGRDKMIRELTKRMLLNILSTSMVCINPRIDVFENLIKNNNGT